VQLTRLRVFQFRNFQDEEILFSPGTNLLCGANGQGKTNLLEAVYFLGYGKSFRTAAPRDCILHGASACRVEGTVSIGSLERELAVLLAASGKKLQVHGKDAAIEDFIGNLHLLAFTSEHLNIVRGSPSERRAFLDRGMVTLYPAHVRHLASYSRALKQRNRILSASRDSGIRPDEHLLESWEETLIGDGARLMANRMNYAARMKEKLPAGLFGSEILKLRYISTIRAEQADAATIAEQLRQGMRQARDNDLRSGFTSIGPHRDELKLFVNGKSLADFGSAGQQRSALLCLYFAQMEIHREAHGFYPVFLVDDAEAELDEERMKTFVKHLSDRTQTILTTAKATLMPAMAWEMRRYEIHGGKVFSSASEDRGV
jgi:DNA replication and repair protein RecF